MLKVFIAQFLNTGIIVLIVYMKVRALTCYQQGFACICPCIVDSNHIDARQQSQRKLRRIQLNMVFGCKRVASSASFVASASTMTGRSKYHFHLRPRSDRADRPSLFQIRNLVSAQEMHSSAACPKNQRKPQYATTSRLAVRRAAFSCRTAFCADAHAFLCGNDIRSWDAHSQLPPASCFCVVAWLW
jgi:hypothetical protein